MEGYTIKPRGGFISVGTSNPRFGICDKAWRVGLDLGPSDPGLNCGKAYETGRQENSSWCRWRNLVESMLVLPSDQVEIMVNPIMMCSFYWPSDSGWITVKPGFC